MEYVRHLTFRDHLRSHPEDAMAYAALKRKLADQFRSDRDAYTQAKTKFVEDILGRIPAADKELSSR